MKYYEIHDGNYISEFGVGEKTSAIEISQERYNELVESPRFVPLNEIPGYTYRLTVDLEWVSVKDDSINDPDLNDAEALSILLGGAV